MGASEESQRDARDSREEQCTNNVRKGKPFHGRFLTSKYCNFAETKAVLYG